MLSVKGKVTLTAAGMLLAIGVMGWAGGVAAYQATPDYYMAVGDSVAVGQGASVPERLQSRLPVPPLPTTTCPFWPS
jgi:hypothetical protein